MMGILTPSRACLKLQAARPPMSRVTPTSERYGQDNGGTVSQHEPVRYHFDLLGGLRRGFIGHRCGWRPGGNAGHSEQVTLAVPGRPARGARFGCFECVYEGMPFRLPRRPISVSMWGG